MRGRLGGHVASRRRRKRKGRLRQLASQTAEAPEVGFGQRGQRWHATGRWKESTPIWHLENDSRARDLIFRPPFGRPPLEWV